jgi:uncharacterized protein
VQIVADTNVLLSAYLFRTSTLAWLREAIEQQTITIHLDPATSGELKRVLGYPKFKLLPHEQMAVLMRIVQFAQVYAEPAPSNTILPKCRDVHDQKFLNLAFAVRKAHRKVALVSGDADLLSLAGACPFRIVTPAAFRETVE